MPVITIANTKGGTGKSTICANLAVELVNKGHTICVIDADRQATLFNWNRVRELSIANGAALMPIPTFQVEGSTLISFVSEQKKKGLIVLIDSPGVNDPNHRASLPTADFILTPCSPSPAELWALTNLLGNIQELRKSPKTFARLPIFATAQSGEAPHQPNGKY
ncbi:MAG: ParA family protein [Cytophagales bacterium]|nr:ParA family protein [Cytophagales bacterium]